MRPLARLNEYFWKYRRQFLPGLLCAVASAGFAILVPIVVRHAVDGIPVFVSTYSRFEGTEAEPVLFGYFFGTLALYGLLILVLSLISGLFTFLMRQTIVVASRHIELDLRNALYAHLQTLPERFYRQLSTGDVITRATSDIEHVRRYVGPALMYFSRAIVLVVTAMLVMFIISPRLTFFAILPMPLLAVSVFFLAHLVHSRSDAIQRQYATLTSRVQEALTGIRVLKAYTREEGEARAFEQESAEYRARMLSLARVDSTWRPVFLLLVGMSTVIVVWVGGRLVTEGAITIGNIAEYMIYVALMTWPVAAMGYVITMVQRAAASITRLNFIFDTPPEIADDGRTNPSISTVDGRVRFDNVWFRFEDDSDWILRDISFEIPSGTTLALVGRTGSGKSTLVNMIPRLVEPTAGHILIDGHELTSIPLQVLRSSIGYVPQEVFLFSDSVANNIAFGTLKADADAIGEAAREADLLENVEEFPDGFETSVGERGIMLSGGQKQRTSIARALIRDPRLLILDDALSAVDTNTERNILGHLKRHYGRRTIILVSHRISAVQNADLILVLDDGRIVERGRHDELVLRDGLYASMYRKQLLEQELEALS